MGPKPQKRKGLKVQEKKDGSVRSSLLFDDETQIDVPDLADAAAEGGYEGEEQLELTEEELNQEVTLILKAENPYFREEFVEYNYKDLEYKTINNYPHTVTFFTQSGSVAHKEHPLETDEESVEAEGEKESEEVVVKLKNKFTFCDRAVQTLEPHNRDECLQTEPPEISVFSANACLWDMTSAFENAHQSQPDEGPSEKPVVHKYVHEENDISGLRYETVKVVERMLNQNKFFDIIIDYAFYDNPADEYREGGEGTLLPLWKFKFKRMKGLTVMDISWNRHYPDMFAVAFGSKEFSFDKEGCVCIFSLKCTSYPERIFMFDTNVQCLDFNKQWPHLLATGCSDGSVAVFDIRLLSNEPIATSRGQDLEHGDCVIQVKWLDDDINNHHNFCSIGISGVILHWTLAESELIPTELLVLKREGCSIKGLDNTLIPCITGGTSVSFNADSTDLFLVGTDTGLVHACSCLYANQFLSSFASHTNTVNNVEWNPYHPRVFLTCSADWTIRIWDYTVPESVILFDMHVEVIAAAWAPYSSTLFAAITKDRRVRVFDLLMNKQDNTCVHPVSEATKDITLSSVSFNPKVPILMVGDQTGIISSFKLSPNLRSSIQAMQELEKSKFIEGEIEKMERVLKLAKSPEP